MSSVRVLAVVLLLAMTGGCDFLKSSSPRQTIPETFPTTFRSITGTLEHTVTVEHPSQSIDEERFISITTSVKNVGALTQRITTRICGPQAEDFSAQGIEFTSTEPECEGPITATIDLLPGQATEQLMGRFKLQANPGLYNILVRHVISPSVSTEIRTRIK